MLHTPAPVPRRAILVAALVLCGTASADKPDAAALHTGRYCTATAMNLLAACRHASADGYFRSEASCVNQPDLAARQACHDDATQTRRQSQHACDEQRQARSALCLAVGEDRYAPSFEAAEFQSDFRHPAPANAWFPMIPGYRWKYRGAGETVTVNVLDKTKLIEGVTCIVVNDRVEVDGFAVEDTDDWFALRNDGAVFYCGESVRDFEIFPGDQPVEPELTSRAGSFKAGLAGAVPGLQLAAQPIAGTVYRQEFSPNNAEDVAQILSTSYRYGAEPELDRWVPPGLARLLCGAGDCVVVAEFSPLAPGPAARKYYAPGIGLFLDVKLATGERIRLTQCNVDARCAAVANLARP